MHKSLFALIGLAGCATLPAPPQNVANALVGSWNNSAQMAAAPDSLKRPPVAGGAYEWIDGQYASFFPVSLPALTMDGPQAIYLVWRTGGPSGPISRQRLWVFRTDSSGAIGMDFYAFKDGRAFETATGDSDAFKALTLDDLTAYGPLCTLPVITTQTGWSAAIPATCAITARSGRKMVLSAQISVDRNTLSYREQGILDSGAIAFKVPGGPAYQFIRSGN
jgi:hypothetical protein